MNNHKLSEQHKQNLEVAEYIFGGSIIFAISTLLGITILILTV
jgi:hypothetical protein